MKSLVIIGVIFSVVLVGLFIFLAVEDDELPSGIKVEVLDSLPSDSTAFSEDDECGENHVIFDYPPVNLDKTKVVVPLGLMTGGHVTPIDHQYFQDFDNQEADIEVYSPGDGVIKELSLMSGGYYSGSEYIQWADYRLVIEHGCGVSSSYIHIDELSDKILIEAPKTTGYKSVNILVEAGQIIGWYKNNVDYNIVDENIVLEGLLIPEHYEGEPWKIHVPDTLEYFNEEITSKMIEKSLRSSEPYAGKLDWDIDSKLRGNWFEEGTNYYTGLQREKYWSTHLSISPDYLDYNHITISMGNYDGQEAQFGVKGNFPNPKDVDVNTGLVKYELVGYDYYDSFGVRWERTNFVKISEARNYDFVDGVVLLEMIQDRRLKFEAFPGKTAVEVSGFTTDALIYER
ncbi:MAG: hypothetical protein IH845_03955 [Nanoarchaeota archaeon]|nr:hypothetical protein [Nanoarchaeota archaeon]